MIKVGVFMERGKQEPVEVICPKCRYTEIIYLPIEDLPRCPECNTPMSINELLDEGKSY
jgi:ribosomal protein S27E